VRIRATEFRLRNAVTPILLVLVGAVVPAAIALVVGLGDVPRNDDWSYRWIARHLFEWGEMRLDGASQSFAIGQILATLPILALSGGDEIAFWFVGLIFSVIALIAAYDLARSFVASFDAALIVLALLVAPGYLAYSSSYMTDVPALALTLASLACGVRAIRAGAIDLRWAIAAIAIGILGFSIRQFAVAAPVAVIVGLLLVDRRRAGLLGVCTLGLIAGVALFQRTLEGQVGATPVLPGGLWRAAALLPSTALFLLPISVRAIWIRRDVGGRIPRSFGTLAVSGVLLLMVLAGQVSITLGNLLSPWGVPAWGNLVGGRPAILDGTAWLALQVVALFSTLLLVDAGTRAVISRLRLAGGSSVTGHPIAVLLAFLGITTAGLVAYSMLFAFFDRYLWPLVVPLGILLLAPAAQTSPSSPESSRSGAQAVSRAMPIALTAAIGLLAVVYALNSYSFDIGRWRAGERLVALGVSPQNVDAGYEWVGTYAPGPVHINDHQIRPPHPLAWYGNVWPNLERCAIVAGTPLDLEEFELLEAERQAYRQFLVVGPEVPLYLYRSTSDPCRGSATHW
jgi:hypothetical protein